MKYIYESHMGGLFCSDDIIEDTYCEQCGDSDWLIGSANNIKEAWELLKDKTNTFDDSKCESCSHKDDYDYCDEKCEEFSNSGGYNLGYVMDFLVENFKTNSKTHEIYLIGMAKQDNSYIFANFQPSGHRFGEINAIPVQRCINEKYVNQLARGLAFVLDNPDYSTLRKIDVINEKNKTIHIFEILDDIPSDNDTWNNSAHYMNDGWYGYIHRSNIKFPQYQKFLDKYIK